MEMFKVHSLLKYEQNITTTYYDYMMIYCVNTNVLRYLIMLVVTININFTLKYNCFERHIWEGQILLWPHMTTFWGLLRSLSKLHFTICNIGRHTLSYDSDNCVPSHRDHFHTCDYLQHRPSCSTHPIMHLEQLRVQTECDWEPCVCLILVDWDWTSRRHLCPALPGVMVLCKFSRVRKTCSSRALVMWLHVAATVGKWMICLSCQFVLDVQ